MRFLLCVLFLSGCSTTQAQAWAAGMQAYHPAPAPVQQQPQAAQNCTTERVGQTYYTHCY